MTNHSVEAAEPAKARTWAEIAFPLPVLEGEILISFNHQDAVVVSREKLPQTLRHMADVFERDAAARKAED